MDSGMKWAAGGLLIAALLAVNPAAGSDVCNCDCPDPFAPPSVVKENLGAKARHAFHDIRTTWDKYFEVYPAELDGHEVTTFEKVRENPGFYLDRKIRFDIYYGKSGQFYRPFTSPFHSDGYVNFGAWSYGANLWRAEGRASVHPLYYIDKRKTKLIDKLAHLPIYTPVHVWATVRSKSDNLPWIEILGAEIIPEAALSDDTLRHIELGVSQLGKKRFDLAAQTFDAAIALELPVKAEAEVYPLLGRAYFELRLYNKARCALVNAILRNDRDVPTLILLAKTDLRLEMYDEARKAAVAALKIEPGNPRARAELGLALAMQGKVREGFRELEYAEKLAPRNQLHEANRNRAMIYVMQKELELAEKEMASAVLLRGLDFVPHLELGDILMLRGKLEDARREYTQSRDLAPARPEPHYKTAVVLKAIADNLAKEGKADEAKKLYEEALVSVQAAIARDEHYVAAYGLEAELLRLLGRAADAVKAVEKGVAANPNDAGMQDILYREAAAAGDWSAMERATRAALGLRANAERYSQLGNILAGKPDPDYSGAAEAYQSALRLSPDRIDDLAALSHLQVHMLGQYGSAESALARVVEAQPENGGAWYDLSIARRNVGSYEGAVIAADRAVELNKNASSRIAAAHARVNRNAPGDLAAAEEMAKAAAAEATLESDKAWASAIIGAVALTNGKAAEAQSAFAAAEPQLKDNAEFNLWYGTAMLRNNDPLQATDKLQLALTQSRGGPVAVEAAKSLKFAQEMSKGRTIRIEESAPSRTVEIKPAGEGEKKPMPPVVEDNNGNGGTEPVPIEVPGPR
jgi:tetratricopeptide (TPR) repeat protein